jgi:hypothetical protein
MNRCKIGLDAFDINRNSTEISEDKRMLSLVFIGKRVFKVT